MSEKNHLITAYNHMLVTLHDWVKKAGKQTSPLIDKGIDKAREATSEISELSSEELNKVSDWLRRDLETAGNWLGENSDEFRDTLSFDLKLVEAELLEAFSTVADRTTLELKELEYHATLVGEWHTGEITGIGSLTCCACGEELHFHATGHIPPCPKCHGTKFKKNFQ
jgi:hypothetical protein